MEFGLELLRLAGSLALVLGLFFACMYALRRWGYRGKRPSAQPLMEVLAKQSFGPRHHLILVKVPGERDVLVGISPQNMSILSLSVPDGHGRAAPGTEENL